MANDTGIFEVDTDQVEDDRIHIRIPHAGAHVEVNVTEEGIIVDIWPDNAENGSVATAAATFEEIQVTGEYA